MLYIKTVEFTHLDKGEDFTTKAILSPDAMTEYLSDVLESAINDEYRTVKFERIYHDPDNKEYKVTVKINEPYLKAISVTTIKSINDTADHLIVDGNTHLLYDDEEY